MKIVEETRHSKVSESLKDYSEKVGKLFAKPELGEDEEPPEKAPVGNVPNYASVGR